MVAGRGLIDERLCFFFWLGQVLAIGSLMVVKLRLMRRPSHTVAHGRSMNAGSGARRRSRDSREDGPRGYDVAPDGKRFLMVQHVTAAAAAPGLHGLVDW
jgi:hypothetical protein